MRSGGANLRKQIENVLLHGVTPVVAINAFPEDSESEYAAIRRDRRVHGRPVARCPPTSADGGAGATELAEAVVAAAEEPSRFHFLYPSEASLRDKIEAIATQVYGADGVDYQPAAARQPRPLRSQWPRRLPVVHRQDPSVHLLEPRPQRGPHRVATPGSRGAGLGGSGIHLRHLRGHADHARAESTSGRRTHRHR